MRKTHKNYVDEVTIKYVKQEPGSIEGKKGRKRLEGRGMLFS